MVENPAHATVDNGSLSTDPDIDMDDAISLGGNSGATTGLSRLQGYIDTLTGQIADLTIKLITDPNDNHVRALFDQKTKDMDKLAQTMDAMRKIPRYGKELGDLAKVRTGLTSDIVPRGLPLFQWTNQVNDQSKPVFPDVTACLLRFQDVMFAHCLDFNDNFLRLVPPCLSSSQRV